jgi:hypothetical protein
MMFSSLWCIETMLRTAFSPIAAYSASEKPGPKSPPDFVTLLLGIRWEHHPPEPPGHELPSHHRVLIDDQVYDLRFLV